VRLDRETEKGISRAEGEIHKRTSISSTGFRQKIRMEVDTSDYATGGVLSMQYEDRRWRLVAFLSKSLTETEKNYKIHDMEMLAVIKRMENWRYLLEGANFKFKVWID